MREKKIYTADSKEACMEIGIIHVCVKSVVQIEKKTSKINYVAFFEKEGQAYSYIDTILKKRQVLSTWIHI